jgi:hypothetical protein
MDGLLLLHVSQKDGVGRIAILSKSLYRRANDIAKAHTSIWGVGIGGFYKASRCSSMQRYELVGRIQRKRFEFP